MTLIKKNEAFSLIELQIALSLMAISSTMAYFSYLDNIKVSMAADCLLTLSNQARLAEHITLSSYNTMAVLHRGTTIIAKQRFPKVNITWHGNFANKHDLSWCSAGYTCGQHGHFEITSNKVSARVVVNEAGRVYLTR